MPDYDHVADIYQRRAAAETPYVVLAIHNFLRVLGSVRGLHVLDLATGEGRSARLLMHHGAASVLGGDVSPAMIRHAIEQNTARQGRRTWPDLRFQVLDARDEGFQLEKRVDVITAMYLLHYAPSMEDLAKMCRLVARNLVPGGRFVSLTLNPDFDPSRQIRDRIAAFGCLEVARVEGPHCQLLIGDRRVDIWQWSRAAHEIALSRAGLADIRWHPLQAPPDRPEIATGAGWYLANPHCIVLSATKRD